MVNELDLALSDMRAKLRSARTEACAKSWARRIALIECDRMSGVATDEFVAALTQIIFEKERK